MSDWRKRAACKDAPTALFFPEKGGSAAAARAICAGCPVWEQCLDDAIDNGDEHGIWGGHTVRERRAIRNQRRQRGEAA